MKAFCNCIGLAIRTILVPRTPRGFENHLENRKIPSYNDGIH